MLVHPVRSSEGASRYRIAAAPDTSSTGSADYLNHLVLYSQEGADVEFLKAHMMVWERHPEPLYSFPDELGVAEGELVQIHSEHLDCAICRLVHAPAGVEGITAASNDENMALHHLWAAGVADHSNGRWVLSQKGPRSIRPEWLLHNPVPVAHIRPDLSLEQRTTWELLCLLQEDGWTSMDLPRKRSARQALPAYIPGQEKIWYKPSAALATPHGMGMYFQCLLRAEECKEQMQDMLA